MGIPYLMRHLASFSESTRLGSSHEPSSRIVESAVIDGPGLVYHVHSVLMSRDGNSLSQVERQPSCGEVSVAVMAYLFLLQASGLKILRIYFDGALPLDKRNTRLSRLEASREQLETFCLSHREGFKWSSNERQHEKINPIRLLQNFHPSSRRSPLPGNPFMVSAVVEDLRTRWTCSEMKKHLPKSLTDIYTMGDGEHRPWSDFTETVPGEADVFCAALASQNPGTAILTSDSDLFLFDFGPKSSIIFFDTITIEDPGTSTAQVESLITIKAMEYRPASISDRLGIPALSYLAHELNQSPRSKIAELVRRAKTASEMSLKSPAYTTFLGVYNLQTILQYDPGDGHALQNLDIRLSELFVQFCWTNRKFRDQDEAPRIYLPFLVEDHSRKCAWAEGVELRRLAYSLLGMKSSASSTGSNNTAVTECVRRGRRFCFDNIDLYSIDGGEIEKQSASLLGELEAFQKRYHNYNHDDDDDASYGSIKFWRTYALYEINKDWFATNNYPSALENHVALRSFLGLQRGTGGGNFDGGTIEWDDIHAFAQLQAVLYSLRMIYQSTQEMTPEEGGGGGGGGSIEQLRDILAQLPPLHVLMRSFPEVRGELHGVEVTLITKTRIPS